jgi:hypothetical protein
MRTDGTTGTVYTRGERERCGEFKSELDGEGELSNGMDENGIGGKLGDGGWRTAIRDCGGFEFDGRSHDGTSMRGTTGGDEGWGISRELRRR